MSIAHEAVEIVQASIPGQRKALKYCPWCSPHRDRTHTTYEPCVCDERCGEAACPYELEEFIPPPVPIFKLEVSD